MGKEKILILSYVYKVGNQKHTAKFKKLNKTTVLSKGVIPSEEVEENCQCGNTQCVNGDLWRCMPIDDEGTCAWFVTNEKC